MQKFLIPKIPDLFNDEWVEIIIDFENQTFTAQKLKQAKIPEEWMEYKDYTFPSSLFLDFLTNDIK